MLGHGPGLVCEYVSAFLWRDRKTVKGLNLESEMIGNGETEKHVWVETE